MKLTQAEAVALFVALGFKTADKWDLTKLATKLKKLPDLVDADVLARNDDKAAKAQIKAVSKAISDGEEVEITADSPAGKKAGKGTKKKVAVTAGGGDDDEESEDSEGEEESDDEEEDAEADEEETEDEEGEEEAEASDEDDEEAPAAKKSGKSGKKAAAKKPSANGKATIFGHSVSSVLRWMGKTGWTTKEAKAVAEKLSGGEITQSTINTKIGAGRSANKPNNSCGLIAKLSKDEIKELNARKAKVKVEKK